MNYSGLISQIETEIDRTNATTRIATAINQSMHHLERKFNFNYMKNTDSTPVILAQGAYKIDFPTRYKKMIWFKYLDGTDYYDIIQKSESECLNFYPDVTLDTGEPALFASLHNENKFLIRPTADKAYSVYRSYFAYSTDLAVTTNETNWLLTNSWEILFYGALLEIAAFVGDKEMIPYWKDKYQEVFLDQLKHEISEADALDIPFIVSAY